MDFSIELQASRIVDPRTKEYFKEVSGSYASGHYRSAVVMLWSVVVTDLLYKLDQLSTAYTDSIAISILEEVEKTRTNNPKSPDWERLLVERINERTQLLDPPDFANLVALQKHRHLSAHPILSSSETLYHPNKETARAHIRNALEGVLTKPPVMTKRILNPLLEDIENNSEIFADDKSLEKYLEAKYLKHIPVPVAENIFLSLWRIVFHVEDPRCEENREINFRVLSILYNRNKQIHQHQIHQESTRFSDVGLQGTRFEYFESFVSWHPEIFEHLTDVAKTPLIANSEKTLDNYAAAFYLSESIEEHLNEIKKRVGNGEEIKIETLEYLLEVASENNLDTIIADINITQFSGVRSYDAADHAFEYLILPVLDTLSKDQLIELVGSINLNDQIWSRGKARSTNKLIDKRIQQVFGSTFEYDFYPEFSNRRESTI